MEYRIRIRKVDLPSVTKPTKVCQAGSDWPGGEGGVPPQAPCIIKFIRIDIDLYIR